MTFQEGDQVISDGMIYRVRYANADIVVLRRMSDGHLRMYTPAALAEEQVPWVWDGRGWWSQMRDVFP